ncbi:MAG: GDP-mannose 4,6-dehydratase, partial [Anaerolineales bacterium]|nr:GDP-mannose 4,6-dehydratase [Anaerolineales bacterium]
MRHLFNQTFDGRTVLVTGHTGFKGSWLTIWLKELGANVIGYSLEEPPTEPSNYVVSGVGQQITDIRGDIRDYGRLLTVIEQHKPTLIFHLAAQPIVLRSVAEPRLTLETNALGTINVLEAIRNTNSVKALVSITT